MLSLRLYIRCLVTEATLLLPSALDEILFQFLGNLFNIMIENVKPHFVVTLLSHNVQPKTTGICQYTKVYPKVSGQAAWSDNCKWYSSLPLGVIVSLFYESV
jgi:hypothetical protein